MYSAAVQVDPDLPAIHGGRPLFPERFRFIQPTLPPLQEVLSHYQHAYDAGLITNGALVTRLEAEIAERLGVRHCVAVSSCTNGMAMVLRALGVTGEVILPSFTFFATGHVGLWNNLHPVFADCDDRSWTIDPDDVERLITPRTSAILAVHMYGNPCQVERLSAIATRSGLKLIFDAAHGFGSRHDSRPIGQFGDAEVFSLSPTKLLVAGEGGVVATNDSLLAHQVRAARNYGDLGAYDPELLGLSARMPEYNAALALAGLPLVDKKVCRHNEIASAYTRLLTGIPGLTFQNVREQDTCTYKDYSVRVNADDFGLSRDELASALLAENIETKKYFYPPMHKQSLYKQYYSPATSPLTSTDWVADGVLSLPIYESLPDHTVERIASAVRRVFNWVRTHS